MNTPTTQELEAAAQSLRYWLTRLIAQAMAGYLPREGE